MDEIIIALDTPRGGKNERQHRYVIPKGKKWTSLATKQSAVQKGTNSKYGFFFHTVVPQTAERSGDETLYLYHKNFSSFEKKRRDKCGALLKKWFDEDREKTIKAIDWKTVDNSGVVQSDELSILYEQINKTLGSAKSKGAPPWIQICGVLLALVALGTFLIGFPKGKGAGGEDPAGANSLTATESTKPKPPYDIDEANSLFLLFEFESHEHRTRENLKNALDLTWKFYCRQPKKSLEDYLQDEDIKRLTSKLKESRVGDVKQILVLGEDSPDDNWKENFNGINPVRFHQTIEALVELQGASSQFPDCPLKDILQRLKIDRGDDVKWNLQGLWPTFYFPGIMLPNGEQYLSDLRNMEILKTSLREIVMGETNPNDANKSIEELTTLLVQIDEKERTQAEREIYNSLEFSRFMETIKAFLDSINNASN